MTLRIIFAGTPAFAVPSLAALIANHEVCAVYTKPDQPAGRGLKIKHSEVKQYMVDHFPQIPILQPTTLKDIDVQNEIKNFAADLMVVVAYGLILPQEVLALFKYGCINVHASLLPRWRGAAPIQRAILAGDAETGVSIMQMEAGLDTGPVWSFQKITVNDDDTAQTLHDKLAALGAETLIATISTIAASTTIPQTQNNDHAIYADKIKKEEALVDWNQPARYILNQVRAFTPWPIAYTHFRGELLKLWHVEMINEKALGEFPGLIIAANEKGIDVSTKSGIIRLLSVQLAGGKPMSVGAFLNSRGHLIVPGKTLLGDANVHHP